MAHYAFINDSNIVTEVITGIDENDLIEGLTPEKWYEKFKGNKCIRTSYNAKIRYNYAGVGYFYDELADAFIPPKPCSHIELVLNKSVYNWTCTNAEHEVKND